MPLPHVSHRPPLELFITRNQAAPPPPYSRGPVDHRSDGDLSDSDTLFQSSGEPSPASSTSSVYCSVRDSIIPHCDNSHLTNSAAIYLRPSRSYSGFGKEITSPPQSYFHHTASDTSVRYTNGPHATLASAAYTFDNRQGAPTHRRVGSRDEIVYCADKHSLGPNGQLTRAALREFINYLTSAHGHSDDRMLSKFFWSNVRLQVGAQECLDVVRELYTARMVDALVSKHDGDLAGAGHVEGFALRLASQLLAWISFGWKPESDGPITAQLREFIVCDIAQYHPETADELLTALEHTVATPPRWPSRVLMIQHLAQPVRLPPTAFIFPRDVVRGSLPFLRAFNTPAARTEFARQLTLIFSEEWRSLVPGDLWCAWFFGGDDFRPGNAVPEKGLLSLYNRLCAWVSMTVFEAGDEYACVRTTEFWMDIAKVLFQQRNFHATNAIIDALSRMAVSRRWHRTMGIVYACAPSTERTKPVRTCNTPKVFRGLMRRNSDKRQPEADYVNREPQPSVHPPEELYPWFAEQDALWRRAGKTTYWHIFNPRCNEPTVPAMGQHKGSAIRSHFSKTVTEESGDRKVFLVDIVRKMSVKVDELEGLHKAYPYTPRPEIIAWLTDTLNRCANYKLPF